MLALVLLLRFVRAEMPLVWYIGRGGREDEMGRERLGRSRLEETRRHRAEGMQPVQRSW